MHSIRNWLKLDVHGMEIATLQYFKSPADFHHVHAGGCIARSGTCLEKSLIRFQLCLYHKVKSSAQFTSVKNCPRCPHTLDLAQSGH